MQQFTSKFFRLVSAFLFTDFFSLQATEVCQQRTNHPTLFKIGLAQLSITPEKQQIMAGYGIYFGFKSLTRVNSRGIHDPIYSSAIWLQNKAEEATALISLDLVGVSRAMLARVENGIKEATQLPKIDIVLSASHTHHAPDVLGLWGAMPFFSGRDPEYMIFLEQRITQSILLAAQDARCSSINWAQGFKETTWHGLLPKGSEREESIYSLDFIDALTGLSRGTFTQWSAHPTVLGPENKTVSSDFPGAFRYFLAKKRPGQHFYFSGMLGASYIPLGGDDFLNDPFVEGDRDPAVVRSYEQMSYHGFDLASKVDKILAENSRPIRQAGIEIIRRKFSFEFDNLLFKLADFLKIIESRQNQHNLGDSEIVLIRVGELQFASIPGEIFPSGSGKIRQLLEKNQSGPVIFLGNSNDSLGYLMSPEEYSDPKNLYFRILSPHKNIMDKIVKEFQKILE